LVIYGGSAIYHGWKMEERKNKPQKTLEQISKQSPAPGTLVGGLKHTTKNEKEKELLGRNTSDFGLRIDPKQILERGEKRNPLSRVGKLGDLQVSKKKKWIKKTPPPQNETAREESNPIRQQTGGENKLRNISSGKTGR